MRVYETCSKCGAVHIGNSNAWFKRQNHRGETLICGIVNLDKFQICCTDPKIRGLYLVVVGEVESKRLGGLKFTWGFEYWTQEDIMKLTCPMIDDAVKKTIRTLMLAFSQFIEVKTTPLYMDDFGYRTTTTTSSWAMWGINEPAE